MGFLRRLVGGSKPGPDWAGGMSEYEFRSFLSTVEADLQRRGATFEIDPEGSVRSNMGRAEGEEPATFGLGNLAQLCSGTDRRRWAEVIAGHFDNTLRSDAESSELVGEAPDFDRVRSLLKIRLYPAEYAEAAQGTAWIQRALAPGILAVLVYDLPSTIRTVPAEETEPWPVGHAELFDLGLDNVRRSDPVEQTTMQVDDGTAITALFADHFFAATHALLLDDHLGRDLPYGALVAVPHRHAVLAAPIRDVGIVKTVQGIISVAHAMHREGPGSISPSLYWLRGGTFSELPVRFERKSIQFFPPDAFVEVLNRLPPPS